MATKILILVAAFVAGCATYQMLPRTRTVHVPPMGHVKVPVRRTGIALFLYGVAALLAGIAWIVSQP